MFGRSSTSTPHRPPRSARATPSSRSAPSRARTDPAIAQEARRDKFGGLNSGAAFFGWLVAIGSERSC